MEHREIQRFNAFIGLCIGRFQVIKIIFVA